MERRMPSSRLFALATVVIGLVVVAVFLPSQSPPRGIVRHGPSEGPLLHDRHAALYRIERDVASGNLSLSDAIDLVLPLIQEDARLRHSCDYPGNGRLRAGVAMLLCEWAENVASKDPEAVSDTVLERLHADRVEIWRVERK
jgi:hypothetical protein